MAGTTRASALTSQPPRHTVHGKGVLTPPARKVNNDDVRLRQTPFHAPFWNSKPTLPVGCWDPMLEPNAGCLPSATFPSAMPIRQNGEWYQEIHQVKCSMDSSEDSARSQPNQSSCGNASMFIVVCNSNFPRRQPAKRPSRSAMRDRALTTRSHHIARADLDPPFFPWRHPTPRCHDPNIHLFGCH